MPNGQKLQAKHNFSKLCQVEFLVIFILHHVDNVKYYVIIFFMPQKAKFELPNQEVLIKTIGKNIANIRKKKGLTQKELSEKIGITQKLLSHYEIGRLKISSDMLIQISSVLNVSADILLGLKNVKNNGLKFSLKIIRRLREIEKLSENQQKTILKSLDLMIDSAKRQQKKE